MPCFGTRPVVATSVPSMSMKVQVKRVAASVCRRQMRWAAKMRSALKMSLQGVDVGRREAAEVAGGSQIGNAAGMGAIENTSSGPRLSRCL